MKTTEQRQAILPGADGSQATGAYYPIYWDDRGYFIGPMRHWKIYNRCV
ncbi:hypothetical protein PB55_91 [Pseudomonas phage vB_PaeM_B55]|uniref:Uncharacterized protein n=1 Tax=Pseudomonas phage vB_PaeM_B55 TaxID=3022057 RepID=A0AAE9WLE3_9CAUD|nr:hypothetical protein QE344_gp108 [Pseudomonas phage vB_PaeM_B55]WBY51943.1 hypothetical protein PB55_91 [Pseudomonas phage vB_PaeM_B55]